MVNEVNKSSFSEQSVTNILLGIIAIELYDHFHPGQLQVVWFWGIVALTFWFCYQIIKHFVVWNLPKVRKEREVNASRNLAYSAYRQKLHLLERNTNT